MIKTTKIYARFASEVYDDFGESYSEQEYYRKEHADEEIRATKYALWMARAIRARICKENWKSVIGMDVGYNGNSIDPRLIAKKWRWAERKCLEKAKEFE